MGRRSAERGGKRQGEGDHRGWKPVADLADADSRFYEEVDWQVDKLGKLVEIGAQMGGRMMTALMDIDEEGRTHRGRKD